MAKAKCFISFDYDHDWALKEFLIGQSKHPDSPFDITDTSITEATQGWRAIARSKIKRSDIVIVICGKNTHTATGVSVELEIAQEEEKPYFLLDGYSSGVNTTPASAKSNDKLYQWTWDNLKKLIHGGR